MVGMIVMGVVWIVLLCAVFCIGRWVGKQSMKDYKERLDTVRNLMKQEEEKAMGKYDKDKRECDLAQYLIYGRVVRLLSPACAVPPARWPDPPASMRQEDTE